MEPVRVDIRDKNQFILVQGKVVRTPLTVDISSEQELSRLKTIINSHGISDYSIRTLKEILEEEYKRKKKAPQVVTTSKTGTKTKRTIIQGSTLGKMLEDG